MSLIINKNNVDRFGKIEFVPKRFGDDFARTEVKLFLKPGAQYEEAMYCEEIGLKSYRLNPEDIVASAMLKTCRGKFEAWVLDEKLIEESLDGILYHNSGLEGRDWDGDGFNSAVQAFESQGCIKLS